jgi:hypothetical protein
MENYEIEITITMKKILLLFFCVLSLAQLSMAQENKRITKMLEKKYSFVCFQDDWYEVRNGDKQGACDLKGNLIVAPAYDDIFFDVEYDYYIVKINGKTGIVNNSGSLIIPCKYDDIYYYQVKDNFNGGYCEFKLNGKKGIMKSDGTVVVPAKYDDTYFWQFKNDDFCEVKLNGKQGIVDKQGKEIVACKYDNTRSWQFKDNDFCEVFIGEKRGIVDKHGNVILPIEYSYVRELYDDNQKMRKDFVIVSKVGVADIENYQPVGCKYGVYGLIKKAIVVPCKYDDLSGPDEGLFVFNEGGVYDIKKKTVIGGKWGYVDLNGKEIIPAKYDQASVFDKGVAQVTLDGVTSVLTNPLTGTKMKISNEGNPIKVDINIPLSNKKNEDSFAFIIANENYKNCSADYAVNDGTVFAQYCEKTLGIPKQNIRIYEDATYGNMIEALKRMSDIADAYDGDAKIVFYYSGLGITDDASEKYLLPVDASLTSLSKTAFSMTQLYQQINSKPTKFSLVLLDTDFSGKDRAGKSITQSRGVRISNKHEKPLGNTVVFSAADNGQTAYADKSLGHGLFTYELLDKMQQSNGIFTINELFDYVTTKTKQKSLQKFNAVQSPNIATPDNSSSVINKIKF